MKAEEERLAEEQRLKDERKKDEEHEIKSWPQSVRSLSKRAMTFAALSPCNTNAHR